MAGRYGLEIRRADAGDAPGVAELFAACGRTGDARAVAIGLDRLDAAGAVVLLAMEWGPPSGVVVLCVIPALDGSTSTAWISVLLVDPQARRRGVGRLLLKSASQAARQAGCAMLSLVAPPQAEAGRAFCLATGFAISGEMFERPVRKR